MTYTINIQVGSIKQMDNHKIVNTFHCSKVEDDDVNEMTNYWVVKKSLYIKFDFMKG